VPLYFEIRCDFTRVITTHPPKEHIIVVLRIAVWMTAVAEVLAVIREGTASQAGSRLNVLL
jgi:hypothetical protein